MARAYEEIAVDGIIDYLESNLPAKLATIDSTLVAPVDYVKAFVPGDNRSPLLQAYDENTEPYEEAGHRHAMAVVDCTIAISLSGTTDVEANELKMRRYIQAIRDTIADDYSLGSTVTQCEWTDADRDFAIEADSMTRHVRALGVAVLVEDL